MIELQAIIIIGAAGIGVSVYAVIGGFVYAWARGKQTEQPFDALAGFFWPLVLPFLGLHALASIGPRYMARRREAARLPRAEVRR